MALIYDLVTSQLGVGAPRRRKKDDDVSNAVPSSAIRLPESSVLPTAAATPMSSGRRTRGGSWPATHNQKYVFSSFLAVDGGDSSKWISQNATLEQLLIAARTALRRVNAERYTGLHGRSTVGAESTSPTLISMATLPRGLQDHAASALALTEHCLELLDSRTKRNGAPEPPALSNVAHDAISKQVGAKKRRRNGYEVGAASVVSGDAHLPAGHSSSRFLADDTGSHVSSSFQHLPTPHFAALDMNTMPGRSPTNAQHRLAGGQRLPPPGQSAQGSYHGAAQHTHGHHFVHAPPNAAFHTAGAPHYHGVPPPHHAIIDPLAGLRANVAPPVPLTSTPHQSGGMLYASSGFMSHSLHAPPQSHGLVGGATHTPRHSVVSGASKPSATDGDDGQHSDSGHSSDSSSLASISPAAQQDGILAALAKDNSSNLLPAGEDRGHSTSPRDRHPVKPPSKPRSGSFSQGGLLLGIAGDTAPHNVMLRPKATSSTSSMPTPTATASNARVDASPALLPTPEPPQPVPAGMTRGNQEATREALLAEVSDLFAHLPADMRSLPLSHLASQGWRHRARFLNCEPADAAELRGAAIALKTRKPRAPAEHARATDANSESVHSSPALHSSKHLPPRRAASEADAGELSNALSEAFCRARGHRGAASGMSKLNLNDSKHVVKSDSQVSELLSPTLLLLHGMVSAKHGASGAQQRMKVGANPSATTRDLRRSDAALQWAAARAAAAMATGGHAQSSRGAQGRLNAPSASTGMPSGQSALELLTGSNLFPGAEALSSEVEVKLRAIAAAQGAPAQSVTGGSALLGPSGDKGSLKRAPASVTFDKLPNGSTLSGSRV